MKHDYLDWPLLLSEERKEKGMKGMMFWLSKGQQHTPTHMHSCFYAFVRTFVETIQFRGPYPD